MKKIIFLFILSLILSQICFGNPPPVNHPDKLGVSMIGSYVRDYRDYQYVTGTAYPNVIPLTCTGYTVQGILPENVSLTSIESLYLGNSYTSYWWPASDWGLTSHHSFTATFNTGEYVETGSTTIELWADYDNYYAQIDAMITVTVPDIAYFWPQEPPSPGSTITREIYPVNVPVSATLPTPCDEPAVGLFKDGEVFTTTMYTSMMPGFSYLFQMDLPATMESGDWFLYMLYDYNDFRYRICETFPIVDDLVYPSRAYPEAPEDGSVVPTGDVTFIWDYRGTVTPTGYELWYGTGLVTQTIDIPFGNGSYTEVFTQTAQTYSWFVEPYIVDGTDPRTYPQDDPVVWGFTTWDPSPPPAPPIPPTGGTTTLNGGANGSGVGVNVIMNTTGAPPSEPIIVTQTDPTTLGVPLPENALDIAFTIETVGTITDPITFTIEWDFPVPTPPSSGSPTLLVNHGSGWVSHPVDDWDYDDAPYWIQFTTDELSDWVIGEGDDNPLPVSLSSFTVEFANDHPVLNWTTQSETDNLGWYIYRSLNQNGFAENDYTLSNSEMVPGMGISTQPTEYGFIDEYPVIEGLTYYYWLQSVSTINEYELFGPVSLQIPLQGLIPHVVLETALNPNYPNPFNPSTLIRFSIEEGERGIFTIYNIKGQIVQRSKYESGEYEMEWNAENLASGIYLYRLRTSSRDITKKMLLMK